jgi:DnaJ-class molecular chaperone
MNQIERKWAGLVEWCSVCSGEGVLPARVCEEQPFATRCPTCSGYGIVVRIVEPPKRQETLLSFAA